MAIPVEQFLGLGKKESVLDMMQSREVDMEALKAMVPMQMDGVSPSLPPELVGKTVKQLRDLGAKDLGSVTFNSSLKNHGFDTSFTQTLETEEQAKKSLKELEQDDQDKEFLLDNIGAEGERF